MAHTPGPWRVDGARIRDCEPGIDCIATMQVSNQPNWCDDARLISAAPDLLEALQEALDLIETISPIEGATVRKAHAAIAKAKIT